MSLKSEKEIYYSINNLTKAIRNASCYATSNQNKTQIKEECPVIVKQKIIKKQKLRKQCQQSRSKTDKMRLNTAAKDLNELLHNVKNQSTQEYFGGTWA